MALFFGRSGMAWLAIIGQLFLLINVLQPAQCYPLDSSQTVSSALDKRVAGGGKITTPGRYTKIHLHSSCAGKESFFKDSLDNMLKVTSSAKTSIGSLKKALSKDRKNMSPAEKSIVDLFQTMYGIFDPKDKKSLQFAQEKLKIVSSFVDKYAQGLSGNAIRLDVFCDQNVWETGGQKDEDDDYIFRLPGEPQANPTTNEDRDICKDEKGKDTTLAFITGTQNNSKDYMTVCPTAWTEWKGETLVQKRATGLKKLKGKALDAILNKTPESLFLHEVTHVESFFGNKKLDDMDLNSGDTAYEFVDIKTLAEEDKDKKKIQAVRPLNNADTMMYFLAGLYLSSEGNWADGICRDPKKVE